MSKKIISTSKFVVQSFDKIEKRMFAAIKRDILKEIITPKNADLIMVDVIGCEYIKYVRALQAGQPRIAIASAKAMREYLAELNLTPHSRVETNTTSTLSTIFKILNKEDNDARDTQEIQRTEWVPELHT